MAIDEYGSDLNIKIRKASDEARQLLKEDKIELAFLKLKEVIILMKEALENASTFNG